MSFAPLAEPKISLQDCEAVSKQIASTFIGCSKANEELGQKITQITNQKFAIENYLWNI